MQSNPFMNEAMNEARAAAARGEVPVGAVLVDGAGVIIARAGNRTQEWNDPTAHAEMLVLREGGRIKGAPRLPDCTLYVTLEPCAMCAAAISFARLSRLVYGAYDVKGGAVDHGARFFTLSTCHHTPDVFGGVGEAEAKKILHDFFETRRDEEKAR